MNILFYGSINEERRVVVLFILLLNACVRVVDVMTFTFVSLMPVHNVCRIMYNHKRVTLKYIK